MDDDLYMKIVIVGTGSIGRRHIENILRVEPKAEFIFLRQSGRHDSLSEGLGARVVTSVEQAVKFNPDCAIIATPSSLHTDFVLAFIQYGIAMYVEKPVVINQPDIERVYVSIKEFDYRATTLVGCNLRFLNSLRAMKEVLESGRLGQVARGVFQAGQWLPGWRPAQNYQDSYSADPERGGGVIWDLIHEIDSARYLLGDFERVMSMTSLYAPLKIKSDAVANILLGKKNGSPLISIGLDYVARKPVRRYEIYGEKGALIWDLPQQRLLFEDENGMELITDDPEDFNVAKTYEVAIKEFLSAVKSDSDTSQNIQEGLKSAELAVKAKEQV